MQLTPQQKANLFKDTSRKIYELARTAPDAARHSQEYLIQCELRKVFEAGRNDGIDYATRPDAPRHGW